MADASSRESEKASDEDGASAECLRELVYDREAWATIKEHWPHAEFEDASDFIHEGRFHVTIDGLSEQDFYVTMIREGWAEMCLGFAMMMRIPERQDDLRSWLDICKAQREQGIPIGASACDLGGGSRHVR